MILVDVLLFLIRNKNVKLTPSSFFFFFCTPLLGSNTLYSDKVNGTKSGKAAGVVWINLA